MTISYYTDVGRMRKENQDSVFAEQINDNTFLLIVADGMGGHNGGKTASSTAISVISKHIKEKCAKPFNDDEAKHMVMDSISKANMEIYCQAFGNEKLKDMGTTAVVALITEKKLYTANVGDSRLYILSKGKFKQITTDHSYVETLVARGLITPVEAKTHPQKNIITRAVGTDSFVDIDLFENSLCDDDVVLICSDGLHTMVSDEDIVSILNDDISTASQKLVSLANANGGRDNISVIAVKIN